MTPTWSPKMMPTWLYRQDFAKFSLKRHYNDVSALDRFSVHRCPTRWVFSGTGLKLVTKAATIRYLYHSAISNLEGEQLGGGHRPPNSLPLPSTLREDLRLDGCLEYPMPREGTIHLQTTMPSLGFEPRPYGTVVSVTNHHTGWERCFIIINRPKAIQ
ncbi:hypothetical protein TNCV_267251 [Trichonephila clavipes]|nr:hypothetical protein TNCV_267251 [Trichonephila clavipes]